MPVKSLTGIFQFKLPLFLLRENDYGIFNTNVCRPVLINITAAEVVSIGVGAEVLREAELSTQTNTYRRTFYAVVDRVAVYVSIVAESS